MGLRDHDDDRGRRSRLPHGLALAAREPAARRRGAAVALCGCLFAANWIRLVLICRNPGGWDYWHEGQGAEIFAVIFAALAIGCAALGGQAAADRERRA